MEKPNKLENTNEKENAMCFYQTQHLKMQKTDNETSGLVYLSCPKVFYLKPTCWTVWWAERFLVWTRTLHRDASNIMRPESFAQTVIMATYICNSRFFTALQIYEFHISKIIIHYLDGLFGPELPVGLLAQLVKRGNGIPEVMGSNPVGSLKFVSSLQCKYMNSYI